MDSITLNIAGNNRHISPSVFLSHVARALANMSLPAGEHRIVIDKDGAIWLNEMQVYKPARPQIAAKGA